MSDIIHLLPDSVANQIAAGEVVQRPSSIVKEMVENAIDAGADDIQVVIVDGGKTCVQVIDNGTGMSETDARMAFERHATSKIAKAQDIYNLSTMGFRGEALASIAAVAQVEMKTRRSEDEVGTLLQIDGAKVVEHKPVACPKGTNIAVRNLFFNIPVRRKFLKKTQTELNNIVQDFERIVLVYPELKFLLTHNDTPVFRLAKSNLKHRIADVYGARLADTLLPVQTETSLVSVTGFVGKPEDAKRKGAKQFFFVNGRFMKHQYFHAAVERAYDNIIPQGEHPNYFIYLHVDPQNIDVNVHPTKTEIKFENEQIIWQVINAVVREAIGKFNKVPVIDFDRKDDDINIPAMPNDGSVVRMQPNRNTTFNPFNSGKREESQRPLYDWQKLYPQEKTDGGAESHEVILQGALSRQVPEQKSIWNMQDEAPDQEKEDWHDDRQDDSKEMFQLNDKFIVCVENNGLRIFDQHRAHVCVLFRDYIQRIDNQGNVAQGMLFPEIIQLSKAEVAALENVEEEIKAVGFELTSLGNGAYSLNAIPPGLESTDYDTLLHNLLFTAMENKNALRQNVQEKLALAMAQNTAVAYGQKLNLNEMRSLVRKLDDAGLPARTPDGKIVWADVDSNYIERLF
ncbi:MAG: DNA mismatch repair endonuclease MutL [Bacteroidaceae bacterium]|nr:DNA mismatch repair endonuclease MutL [Bacteroidaceae bacterium]